MFWIFSRKNTDKKTLANREVLSALYQGDRNIFDLTSRKAELRVWLPSTVFVALKDLAALSNNHRSDYLREFFAHYLYGAHDYERMRQEYTGVFYSASKHVAGTTDLKVKNIKLEEEPLIMESRAPGVECIRGLGKNITPLKIYLASKIKEDLQLLADNAAMPLSRFVREILVSHMLGHTVWPEHISALSNEQVQLATSWEQGEIQAVQINGTDEEIIKRFGKMPDGVVS